MRYHSGSVKAAFLQEHAAFSDAWNSRDGVFFRSSTDRKPVSGSKRGNRPASGADGAVFPFPADGCFNQILYSVSVFPALFLHRSCIWCDEGKGSADKFLFRRNDSAGSVSGYVSKSCLAASVSGDFVYTMLYFHGNVFYERMPVTNAAAGRLDSAAVAGRFDAWQEGFWYNIYVWRLRQ